MYVYIYVRMYEYMYMRVCVYVYVYSLYDDSMSICLCTCMSIWIRTDAPVWLSTIAERPSRLCKAVCCADFCRQIGVSDIGAVSGVQSFGFGGLSFLL